jgi:predicted component of type VI protein secretion system
MSLKDDAITVAVLKTLRDTVDAQYQAARQRVLDGLRTARGELGLKSTRVSLPDGTPVATVTLVDPAPAVVVDDDEAFTAWVAKNYPTEVQTRVEVRASWRRDFLARLDASSDLVADPRTGEVVSGLKAVPAAEPRSFNLRLMPGGTEEIAAAWRRGALDVREVLALDRDAA